MKLLLLSRDSSWFGGVINLVSLWKAHFSTSIQLTEFMIGGRKGKTGRILKYFQPLADAARLYHHVSSNRYDVVHINPSFNLQSLLRDGLFMLVLRRARQPTLVFFHGWDVHLSEKLVSHRLTCWILRASFGQADKILVLANEFKKILVKAGIAPEKIFTITTMFDGKQLGKNFGHKTVSRGSVLFLSRFVREKGIFELIEAFSQLANEFPDAQLTLAGDGPVRNELEQSVTSLNLDDRVKFTGYIRGDDKAAVLRQADIFVLPTYYGEGCPVSLLEAMACGLALVSTPVGGIPDILIDGVNGVLLPSARPGPIYDALKFLLSSPGVLRKIAAHNREIAWQRYEASVVTSDIERYYRQMQST